MLGHISPTTSVLLKSTSILRLIYGKNKDKRHCACVLTGLQMLGHISQTTNVLLKSTSILRFIYGKNKDKRHCACVLTGLQMVGHISQTTNVLLKSTSILRFIYGKNKDKTPLRMRSDGFADGETHVSNHNHAATVHMYITLHLRQKQGQNAIAHAW